MKKQTDRLVVVFDVDCTLLKGDCLWIAIRSSKTFIEIAFAALKCLPWMILWKLGLGKTGHFKQRLISAFGLCEVVNKFKVAGRENWLLDDLQANLRPEAIDRLRWHQRRGDRVLLCSASPRMLLEPLAQWLGVELLCTEFEQNNGIWYPQLISANCKGPEKLIRLEKYLGSLEQYKIEAYGDSKGDRELLQASVLPHYRSFTSQLRPYPNFRVESLITIVAIAMLGYVFVGIKSQGNELIFLLLSLWPQILLGLFLVSLAYLIRYCRWRLLLRALGQHPPIPNDARIWMGSFAFTATPGKSGETVRSFLLKQDHGVPIPSSLVALLMEKLTDFMAAIILLLLNYTFILDWEVPFSVQIALIIMSSVPLIFLWRGRWIKNQIKACVKRSLPGRLANASAESFFCLKKLLKPRLIFIVTIISSAAWGLEGMSLWLLLQGMGINFISVGGAIFTYAAACLIGVFTLIPGGLGSTEASIIGLLSLQGVSVTSAAPATLLIRLITLWFVTFIGVACLTMSGKSHSNLKDPNC